MFGRLDSGITCSILLFVSLWSGAQEQQSTPEPGAKKKSEQTERERVVKERVNILLDTLQSDDRTKALRAEQELLQMGLKAVPQIKERIRSSDAGVLYRLLNQIRFLHASSIKQKGASGSGRPGGRRFTIDRQLSSIEQWLKDTSPPDNEDVLLKRFKDAVTHYKDGEPRRALTLAKALMIVSPDVSFASKVRRFIKKCRERIFNETVLQAHLRTDKIRYGWDESIELTFRIKNVSGKPVTIYFAPPEERVDEPQNDQEKGGSNGEKKTSTDKDSSTSPETNSNQPREAAESSSDGSGTSEKEVRVSSGMSDKHILLEFDHERIALSGNRSTTRGYREYRIPERVHLPPGEAWKKHVTFDTSSFKHRYVLRRFTLRARVTPSFVDVGEDRMLRWLSFGSADFELYPRGMRESLPVTVDKIRRHLKAGNFRDVFFMTFLISSDEHEPLAKTYLRYLPFLKRGNARTIMFLLRELTEQTFYYNREKWLNWGSETYDVDARPPGTKSENPPIPNFDH